MLISCGNENPSEATDIEAEIVALNSSEAKRAYLENIFENDQKLRVELRDPKLVQAERETIWKKIHQVDAINLLKVQKYLEIHGHPGKAEVGEIAALAPWAVIHHQNSLKDRIFFFEPLYAAWLAGDIDDGQLSFYLNRTYEIKTGQRNKMSGPYKTEDEIDLLIQKLDLGKEQSAVLRMQK